MSESWRLVHYVAPGGRCLVYEFLEELRKTDPKAWLVFRDQRRVILEEYGPRAGPQYWVPLGGGLAEIRWPAKHRGHARIYCSLESERRIMMYLGVIKRWKAFSERDECDQYRADVLSAAYDEQKREIERCAYYKRREERHDI